LPTLDRSPTDRGVLTPLMCGRPLSDADYADLRLRTIFECGKYDPQVGDIAVLSRFPLLLEAQEYSRLANLAERLHAETLAAEAELLTRPKLHRRLGLPWSIRRALRAAAASPPNGVARHMRFDFHYTRDGWRISEVNSDVPGGFIESSGFARLMAEHYPGTQLPADPTAALIDSIVRIAPPGARVGFVHATAYADDSQVMSYLAREAPSRDLTPLLLAPDKLNWTDGRAFSIAKNFPGPLDVLMRFFPGEWLPNLPNRCGWKNWFAGGRTMMANPATALLTQSKRFPLVWDDLATPLPTWRSLLPTTIAAPGSNVGDEWVLKPALGRVGAGIGIRGATSAEQWKAIRRGIFWRRSMWVAQARFEAVPVDGFDGWIYPCLGVYTVDGRAAGIYGRISRRPLIDDQAQDIPVLIKQEERS
jgi:glutathionylspermidine synthase